MPAPHSIHELGSFFETGEDAYRAALRSFDERPSADTYNSLVAATQLWVKQLEDGAAAIKSRVGQVKSETAQLIERKRKEAAEQARLFVAQAQSFQTPPPPSTTAGMR